MTHVAEIEQLSKALCIGAEEVEIEVGTPLLPIEELPAHLIYILEGSARLLSKDKNRPRTIHHLTPGSFVGLLSILSTYPIELAIADRPLRGLLIPTSSVVDHLRHNPHLYDGLKDYLFNILYDHICEIASQSFPNKAEFLQKMNIENGTKVSLISSNEFHLDKSEDCEYYLASDNCNGLKFGDRIEGLISLRQRGELPLRIIQIKPNHPDTVQDYARINTLKNNPLKDPSQYSRDRTKNILARDIGQHEPRRPATHKAIPKNKSGSQLLTYLVAVICDELDYPYNRERLKKINGGLCSDDSDYLQSLSIVQSAAKIGLRCDNLKLNKDNLTQYDGVIIANISSTPILVLSSNPSLSLCCDHINGYVDYDTSELSTLLFNDCNELDAFLVVKRNRLVTNRFDLSLFKPYALKYKREIIEVLILSFFVQFVGLFGPLIIQQIIDKVINQRSLSSLSVLGGALLVLTLFEGLFATTRTYLSSAVANRIDFSIGTNLLTHILDLPLSFFDKGSVGDVSTRLNEVEKIRSFFTGQLVTSVLDAVFSILYILIMFIYSPLLATVALAVVPLQAFLTLVSTPRILKHYQQAAEANSNSQSHLVETLSNMITVKSQNLELISRWKWQSSYKDYMSSLFRKTQLSSASSESSKLLQKLSQLLVLWVGVGLVLDAKLTLGGLIAFRIISGYVTSPLLRLTTIFQSYQEIQVSLSRIADLVNRRGESEHDNSLNISMPPIKGEIHVRDVSFRFNKNHKIPILDHVSCSIPQGAFVGIVGSSGSGKSTFTKLICRFYEPDQGYITIDGYDISKVELYSLRSQIGYVPQTPMLFSGTIKDNICAGIQDPSEADLITASQVACAHDFIMALPDGYLSEVGERGASLSGGQMQRIAIARTILADPALLILDEATSALDYKTEHQVFSNIHSHLKKVTTIYITHRLSQANLFDQILFMDSGTVTEAGTHNELLQRRGQYYSLFDQQVNP